MGNIIAKIISYLFHPMLMPTFGIFILFNSGTHMSIHGEQIQRFIYLITIVSTFIFPLLFIPFFVYRNMVKSFAMEHHKERVFPLLIAAVFYFFGYYLIQRFSFHDFFSSFLFGSFVSVFIIFLISLKWKISAHMTGIGGLVGLILSVSMVYQTNMQVFFMATFLVSGLIGFARLKLNAHSPLQVLAGFFLGFISVFVSMLIY